MIEIKNINKKIKNQVILDNISLILNEGKCYGFIGNNGSGKTMLFRAITGLMQVDNGSIKINGIEIGKEQDFIKDAGTIIGESTFINSLSGYDNLLILAEIQNKIGKEDILEVLKKVELIEAKDKKFKSYSLGMKQRLRIAQAIMENNSILILDEPFNGLDKEGTREIQELLLNYKKMGKTILLTSHDERDIELLCDEVFELNSGKLIGSLKC